MFGQLQKYLVISCQPETPAEAVLNRIADLVKQALVETEISQDRVVGIGVGVSGLVDPQSGVNVLAPNLGWREIPIRDALIL